MTADLRVLVVVVMVVSVAPLLVTVEVVVLEGKTYQCETKEKASLFILSKQLLYFELESPNEDLVALEKKGVHAKSD